MVVVVIHGRVHSVIAGARDRALSRVMSVVAFGNTTDEKSLNQSCSWLPKLCPTFLLAQALFALQGCPQKGQP